MGKKSKRPKAFSEKGPTGVPKSNVSATNPAPKLTKEPRQLTTAPQNAENAAVGAVQLFYDQLIKLPLDENVPELFSHFLITKSTLERVGKSCHIRAEKNGFILQDVLETVQQKPDMLDVFCNLLQGLPVAAKLAKQIKEKYDEEKHTEACRTHTTSTKTDTFAANCSGGQRLKRTQFINNWARNPAILAGVAILCVFVYVFGGYFPQVDEIQRTGLPQKPDYFVNREQEQEKIMQSVTGRISHRSRIITITGSPGYGKTTLANVCGHRLVSQRIPVRYVDLQHVCTIKGIVVKILYAVGSTVSHPSKEQLSRWAGYQNSKLVLVLDNVDCFTLSGEGLKKEFSDLIKDFIVHPSQNIHVILTTQYQLGYIDKFQLIALDRLSEAHANELLLLRNPTLTSNVTTALANFTDGNPLALQILSALLQMPNAPPVSTLMKQMQYDPVEALSPDTVHEKLNHVFKVAIGYLSDADHRCIVAACHFPGSFDEAFASDVLHYFVNETVPTCLQHLLARSLLEYNRNTRRYVVLPLLKTFVNSTSQQYGMMASQFFPVYVKHLLQTAMKKQLLSEVHLQNYLKANYLELQYLITEYMNWSSIMVLDLDANVNLIQFALTTFNILPLLQPVNVVEMFWFSVQNLTWNITCEGFEGHCHEYLEPAIEFESLLAEYVLSTGRHDTVVAARLTSRAQESVPIDKLQVIIASNCVKVVTLLRYLGYVANCSRNEVMHQDILRAIMLLASTKNDSSTDADYNIGVIYFELNEYKLAVEFLNRSLTSSPRIQHLNAAKTMVLAYQRSGQHELAVEAVIRLTHTLLEQSRLEIEAAKQSFHSVTNFNYYKLVDNATEMLNRAADNYLTAMDLSLTVKHTQLTWFLFDKTVEDLIALHFPLDPIIVHLEQCLGEAGTDSLFLFHLPTSTWQMFQSCFKIEDINRDLVVHHKFLLSRIGILCKLLKAVMNTAMNNINIYTKAYEIVSGTFSQLQNVEDGLKGMHICERMKTDSFECQIVRSQVRLVWQLQYELSDSLAMFSGHFGMLEQAKEYTEIALEKLPKSSVKRKWKAMVDLKLNLAKIDLSLGNYWNAIYVLRNCSLAIDDQMIVNVYTSTQPSSVWQSHDLSIPDGPFSVIVYHFYHVFNASKVLSAAVSSAVGLVKNAGIGITISHFLFVGIVAILLSFVFLFLCIVGSTLYCVKYCVFTGSTDRHTLWDGFRLFLSNLTIVMCAFSHVVIFHSYILHFHATVLLTYLNYM